jgi:hypothetical protein
MSVNWKKNQTRIIITRPAWAGFKTAEEGRAKICKFFMAKVEEQK